MVDEATFSTWKEMETDLADQQKKEDAAKAEWDRDSEELKIIRATRALIIKAEDRLEEKKYREKKYNGNNVDNDDDWRCAWLKYSCREQ